MFDDAVDDEDTLAGEGEAGGGGEREAADAR